MLPESDGSLGNFCHHGVTRYGAIPVQSSPYFECFGCGFPIILENNLGLSILTNKTSLPRNTNMSESTSSPFTTTPTDPIVLLSGPMVSPSANRHYHPQCFRCYQCDEQFFDCSNGPSTNIATTALELTKKSKPQPGNKFGNNTNSRHKSICEVPIEEKLERGGPHYHQVDSLSYQCRGCFFHQGCRACKKPVLVNVRRLKSVGWDGWLNSLIGGEHGFGEEKFLVVCRDAKYLLFHSRHFNCDNCHASLIGKRFRIVPNVFILQCAACSWFGGSDDYDAHRELSDDDIDELFSSEDEYDERASQKKIRNEGTNSNRPFGRRYKCALCRLRCVCTYLRDAVDNFQALRGQRLVTEFDRKLVAHYVAFPPRFVNDLNLTLTPVANTTNDELVLRFTPESWREAIAAGNEVGFSALTVDERSERLRTLEYHRSLRSARMAYLEESERRKLFRADCCPSDSHNFAVAPHWTSNKCENFSNLALSEAESPVNTVIDDSSSGSDWSDHPVPDVAYPRLCTRCGFCECCFSKRKTEFNPIRHDLAVDLTQPTSLFLTLLSCHGDMQRVILQTIVGRTFEIDILRFNHWETFITIEVNENWTIEFLQARVKKKFDYQSAMQLWLIRNDRNPTGWDNRYNDLVELKLSLTIAEVMVIVLKENYMFAVKMPG